MTRKIAITASLAGILAAAATLLMAYLQLENHLSDEEKVEALPSSPTIEFKTVPGPGEGLDSSGNIAGRLIGVSNPEQYKIVIYAHTNQWYVQPLTENPITDVDGEGRWTNWTHLGNRYGAIAIQESFRPAPQIQALPPLGFNVIAKREVEAASTGN